MLDDSSFTEFSGELGAPFFSFGMITPRHLLVVDDQIGAEGGDRTAFLRSVGYYPATGGKTRVPDYPYEFHFHTGQNADRQNSIEAVKEAVIAKWPDRDGNRWALVLLDVRFGDDPDFGFALLEALRDDQRFKSDLPIVMLNSEDETKRERAGEFQADGFLPKHDQSGHRPLLTRQAVDRQIFDNGLVSDDRQGSERLIGKSLSFLRTLRDARRYAGNPVGPRILYGESGSGKSELAAYIHHHTNRHQRPFVAWFADPANAPLMKDELFGHWKGAHSEARTHQPGKIEGAHGGTFFLDEVSNLPVEVQQAFLQFRKEDDRGWRTIARLGKFPTDDKEALAAEKSLTAGAELLPDHRIRVDVLVMTGTKDNLDNPEVLEEKGFLPDLHNALGTPIICPPLNARREDLPELFEHFIRLTLERPGQTPRMFSIDPRVFEILTRRDWSRRGNVRDLERIAQHCAVQLRDFSVVLPHHLPQDVLEDDEHRSVKKTELTKQVSPAVIAKQSELVLLSDASLPPDLQSPGALALVELRHLRRRAELLEHFAEVTRKLDKATAEPGRYQPTEAVSRLLGAHVSTQNSKRVIAEIVGAILDTPKYLAEAYDAKGLLALRTWTIERPVLMALYRYARGEIRIDEV
jgi:DNA-binding NtrC family response regulator